MSREYLFVGGPLDGKIRDFGDGADWFGFKYLDGEYKTRHNTYRSEPFRLYWWDENSTYKEPEWVAPEQTEAEVSAFEEHLRMLLNGQQGR